MTLAAIIWAYIWQALPRERYNAADELFLSSVARFFRPHKERPFHVLDDGRRTSRTAAIQAFVLAMVGSATPNLLFRGRVLR